MDKYIVHGWFFQVDHKDPDPPADRVSMITGRIFIHAPSSIATSPFDFWLTSFTISMPERIVLVPCISLVSR